MNLRWKLKRKEIFEFQKCLCNISQCKWHELLWMCCCACMRRHHWRLLPQQLYGRTGHLRVEHWKAERIYISGLTELVKGLLSCHSLCLLLFFSLFCHLLPMFERTDDIVRPVRVVSWQVTTRAAWGLCWGCWSTDGQPPLYLHRCLGPWLLWWSLARQGGCKSPSVSVLSKGASKPFFATTGSRTGLYAESKQQMHFSQFQVFSRKFSSMILEAMNSSAGDLWRRSTQRGCAERSALPESKRVAAGAFLWSCWGPVTGVQMVLRTSGLGHRRGIQPMPICTLSGRRFSQELQGWSHPSKNWITWPMCPARPSLRSRSY